MDRVALVLDGETPVNAVVIAEGKAGDDWLSSNPNAVEVTGLDPMPGLGAGWTYSGGLWVAPAIAPLTLEDVEARRRAAYQTYSDPLFFGWQRGENTEQDWLDAVQAVKDANPYPETV
jgi:hypothetical protein